VAASTVTGAHRASTGRLATASSVGTTLEWYDFTVYNTLAALIFNRLFFPSFDPMSGTILAFSTYAVGYLSRPLGGVVFGHLGDKRGRRFVLVLTLVLMGICTGLMGLLPTYTSIGIYSAILLVMLRFVQGVALGGEWAGAVLISVEHGDQARRGRNASFTQVGPSFGTLLATGGIALTTFLVSPDDFLAWAWRIPFLASILLVGFRLWVRRGVDETPMFTRLEESGARAETPIGEVLRHYWPRLLIAGGVRVGSDVLYALVVVFSLTYVTTVLNLSRTLALTAIMTGSLVNALIIPLFGVLSDGVGRRGVYGAGADGDGLGVRLLRARRHWPAAAHHGGRRSRARLSCGHVRTPGRLRDRTVSDPGALRRIVACLYARGHRRWRVCTTHFCEPVSRLSHDNRYLVVCRRGPLCDVHRAPGGARNRQVGLGRVRRREHETFEAAIPGRDPGRDCRSDWWRGLVR
jgi:MFS family permease